MRKILLHLAIGEDYHAGSKAMKDCEEILQKKGYQLLDIRHRDGKQGITGKIKNETQFLKFFSLKKDDIFVIQHPQYIGSRYMKWVELAKKIKKFKLIYIIHDLESLRKMFQDWAEIFEKIDGGMIRTADSMIVHNPKMMEYLADERGVSPEKMVNLGIFDYLTKEPLLPLRENQTDVVVAGNLKPEKSGYIYNLIRENPQLKVNLYGVGFLKPEGKAYDTSYKGAFPADVLPGKLEGKYGLVWDGADTESCTGTTGEYLKYNNPHKVSLYIASGLPVIIWRKAALADFVMENKIGIAVDSLQNLKDVLSKITEQDYAVMKKNAEEMSELVRKGAYMAAAIEKAEGIIRNH